MYVPTRLRVPGVRPPPALREAAGRSGAGGNKNGEKRGFCSLTEGAKAAGTQNYYRRSFMLSSSASQMVSTTFDAFRCTSAGA